MSKDLITVSHQLPDKWAGPQRMSQDLESETGLNQYIWMGVLVVALLMSGLGGWSVLTQLSGAVVVSGTVTVESSRKTVQHPDGGVISEILVKAGDQVERGELLARLDGTIDGADLQAILGQLDELHARQARLKAEADELDHIVFPTHFEDRQGEYDLRQIMIGQRNLFNARMKAKESKLALLEQRILRFEQEVAGLAAQRQAEVAQSDLYDQELKALRSLHKKGYASLTRVLALEREKARVAGAIAGRDAEIARAQNGADEIRLQIIQEKREAQETILIELGDIHSRVALLDERRVAAAERFKRVDIRAPQSGTVLTLNVNTIGGVVQPGEALLEIVPNGEELVIETKVPVETIDKVMAGSRSTVRLSALNQQTTPELNGEVAWVSADSVADARTGSRHYLAHVKIGETKVTEGLDLVPGMPAEVFIQTGARSPISYLLKPLTDNLSRTFTES